MTPEQENAKLRELLLEMHKLVWNDTLLNGAHRRAWLALDKEMAALGFFPHRVKSK